MARYNYYYYDWWGDVNIVVYQTDKEQADNELRNKYGPLYFMECIMYVGQDTTDYAERDKSASMIEQAKGAEVASDK